MSGSLDKKQDKSLTLPCGLPHLAYVLLWFPIFTQPFIFREVECLRKVLPLEIYTLYGKNLRHCSREMRDFSGIVHRFGLASVFSVCWELMVAFCQRPLVIWKLFRKSCIKRWGSWEIFGENLWAFCVGISLARMFREAGIDMVYAPWPRGAATAARVGAILADLPYAVAARGDNLDPPDPDLDEKFAEALFIRANNAADQDRIEEFGSHSAQGKTGMIYNSLTLPQAGVKKNNSFAPNGKLRMLALGRFDVTKGFDDLLKACAILKDKGLDFHLTLAGGGGRIMGLGKLEETLKEMRKKLGLEDYVSMPGLISHDLLPGLMEENDIFVAPCVIHSSGRRDGIPNTVIEAMAYGLPVVSTNVNALPEVIRNGQTGLTVNPRRPDELAETILCLYNNPEQAEAFGKAAAILARELFDCAGNASRMTELVVTSYQSWTMRSKGSPCAG